MNTRHKLARWAYKMIAGHPVPTLPNTGAMVHIIDPSAETYPEQLGITYERIEELSKRIIAIISAETITSKALHEMSKECKHPNELAAMTFAFGCAVGESSSNPLKMLLNAIKP